MSKTKYKIKRNAHTQYKKVSYLVEWILALFYLLISSMLKGAIENRNQKRKKNEDEQMKTNTLEIKTHTHTHITSNDFIFEPVACQ